MRNRFFLTTFFVLIAVSIGTVAIYAHFLRADRLQLIDQQVRETAAALVDSELNDLRKVDFEIADDIISDELGATRIGKFFVIRNEKNDIVYQSSSAKLVSSAEIPQEPQWLEIDGGSKFIRILNLKLPRVKDRTLQVGAVVEKSLIEFNYLSAATLLVFLTVLSIGLVVSWVVSFFLMRPITQLENFLSAAAKEQTSFFPNLPPSLAKGATLASRDEFRRLMYELNEMIEKVNRNYRSSRLWSYQMAHELKTPLTLLQLQAERFASSVPNSPSGFMLLEIGRINEIIQSFLSWAELENSAKQRHLFALRLAKVVETEVDRLRGLYPSRIIVRSSSNPTVLANPQHLEQAIHNLLLNALEYSPESSVVAVEIFENSISISDQGPGVPEDVMQRLGEPFNQGNQGSKKAQSNGLGLAWVKTITRLYNWKLLIDSTVNGSTVRIEFERSPDSAVIADETNLDSDKS